ADQTPMSDKTPQPQVKGAPPTKQQVAKEDSKIKLLRSLGTVLMVLGILGLLLPFFNSWLLSRNSNIDLAEISAESMAKAWDNEQPTPFDEIKEIGHTDFWPLLGQWKPEDIMAELAIPDVEIDLAVFNSASNTNLLAGVGTLLADREPDAGNFVLTGHHVRGKGVLLHNLMDAKTGQMIYLTDKNKIYVYRVIDTAQKDTDAVYMLDIDRNKAYEADSILTIMTCYQGNVSSRWFVVAELEATLDYTPEVWQEKVPEK
ncbi:MAG: class A sortase, partial [Eubacteriales bacterium]|nr:class A sortase [Eubacteriales bacterium]